MDIPAAVLQQALNNKDILGSHGRRLDAIEAVTTGEDPQPFDMTPKDNQPDWGLPFQWDKVANGFSISGATVTIIEPELQIGDEAPHTIVDTDVTITTDYQYVGLQYVWATGVLSITTPNTTKPVPEGSTYRKWLFLFRLQGGAASMHRAGNLGTVVIPAMYGDG